MTVKKFNGEIFKKIKKKNWCSNFVNLWTQREVVHGKKTHDNN